MTRRTLVLAVLGWLALVVLASGATWAVIESVRQDVLTRPGPVPQVAAPPSPSRAPSASPSPSPSPAPSPAPAPIGEVRSWQGRQGSVDARCTGARIALESATPADGYAVRTGAAGPDRVEVVLHAAAGESDLLVGAVCSGGVPVFAARPQNDSSPSDD